MLLNADQNWFDRLSMAGAIWNYSGPGPHAVFEMAPFHTGFYFNTGVVLEKLDLVAEIISSFAKFCSENEIYPDRVVSYSAGIADGQVLAHALAKALKSRSGCVDLIQDRLCFEPNHHEKILIITDDIVSGGSLRRTIDHLQKAGCEIYSTIFTLGNLTGAPIFEGFNVVALFEYKMEIWKEEDCPLCHCGSVALRTRQNWVKLMESKEENSALHRG